MIGHLVPGLLALLLLAACGGGGGGAGDGGGAADVFGDGPVPDTAPTTRLDARVYGESELLVPVQWETYPTPAYDPQTDTFILPEKRSALPPDLPPGAVAIRIVLPEAVLTRVEDDMMPADFAAYNNGSSIIRGVRGEKAGGAAFAVRREGDGVYMFHERFDGTELPTTGRGEFIGTYAGTLGTNDGGINRGTIKGVVFLNVDFAQSTVGGEIFDRSNQNGRDFDEVVLLPTRLYEGDFEARIEGGNSPYLGHTVSSGGYQGSIVGATGNEIVGTMSISHRSSPRFEDLREAGAFVAERR